MDMLQSSNLVPLFTAPTELENPEFIGNAVIDDKFYGTITPVALYQCNYQHQNADTYVYAVIADGDGRLFKKRRVFTLNCTIADEIRRQANIASVIFNSEWL
jgi:hypothetical protein